MEKTAFLDDIQHGSHLVVFRLLFGDGFMPGWVELLSRRTDKFYTETAGTFEKSRRWVVSMPTMKLLVSPSVGVPLLFSRSGLEEVSAMSKRSTMFANSEMNRSLPKRMACSCSRSNRFL